MKTSFFIFSLFYILVTLNLLLLCAEACKYASLKSVEVSDNWKNPQLSFNHKNNELRRVQEWKNNATNKYQQYSGNGLRSTLHTINESTTESTKFNDVNEGDNNKIKIENIAIPNESKDKKKGSAFDTSETMEPCYLCKGANVFDSIMAYNISHKYKGTIIILNVQ